MASDTAQPYLSVIVPAYNEEARLGDSLQRIADYLERAEFSSEILVVDDGSTDRTTEQAEAFLRARSGRVLRVQENRGKGHAVRTGVLEAHGRWVLITDSDLSTPIEEYAKLAQAVRDLDIDGAIGSRGLPDSQVEIHQSFVRETMGKTFNRLVRGLTGLPFHDTQCGFKLFDRQRTLPIFERMVIDHFAFDVELLYACERFGLKVTEVPVIWRNDARSSVSPLTDSPQMLFDILRVRWRFRRGLYNPERNKAAGKGG